MFPLNRIYLLLVFPFVIMACSSVDSTETEGSPFPPLSDVVAEPMDPEQSKAVLSQVGSNWLYGQGVGETALNTGLIFAFPPYGLVVLGNAALSAFGYEQVGLSTLMPAEVKDDYLLAYDAVTSAPGRLSAEVAGKEFIDKQSAGENVAKLLAPQDEEYFPFGSNPF